MLICKTLRHGIYADLVYVILLLAMYGPCTVLYQLV